MWRGAAASAVLGTVLLSVVPAATPTSQAVRFELWSGFWDVRIVAGGTEVIVRNAAFTQHADDRVTGSGQIQGGGTLTITGRAPQPALVLQGALEFVIPGVAPGRSSLTATIENDSTDDTFDYNLFDGRIQGGTVSGFRVSGGPARASLVPIIERSSRIADVGERVTFTVRPTSGGPSGISKGGSRVRMTLNAEEAFVHVVPRHVRRCSIDTGRVRRETIVDCLLLGQGPGLRATVLSVRVSVPRWLGGRALGLTATISDESRFDKVTVAPATRRAAITILSESRPPPPAAAVVNLAGAWMGNDGSRFTVIQRGREVRWRGRSADNGQTWTHNFRGFIRGGFLTGNFQDIVPGRARARGALALRIASRSRLDWVAQVGDVRSFPTFTRRWTRCPKAGCPSQLTGQPVPFPEPRIVDRIKSLGFQTESFSVAACNPSVAGSCDVGNAQSDIRRAARSFCQLRGTTRVAFDTEGMRLGGRPEPYTDEWPNGPFSTRMSRPTERWVNPLNGFVSYTASAPVFSHVTCRTA